MVIINAFFYIIAKKYFNQNTLGSFLTGYMTKENKQSTIKYKVMFVIHDIVSYIIE